MHYDTGSWYRRRLGAGAHERLVRNPDNAYSMGRAAAETRLSPVNEYVETIRCHAAQAQVTMNAPNVRFTGYSPPPLVVTGAGGRFSALLDLT